MSAGAAERGCDATQLDMNEHSFTVWPGHRSAADRLTPRAASRQTRARSSRRRDRRLRPATASSAPRWPMCARAAGVAAGTVYLYFKSKDDLLVSIFERTMTRGDRRRTRGLAGLTGSGEAAAPHRAAAPGERLGARPRPGGRVPGGAAPDDEVHGAVFGDLPARIPRHHSRHHHRRPGARARFAATSTRRWPPRCSSARSTRWPPTGC